MLFADDEIEPLTLLIDHSITTKVTYTIKDNGRRAYVVKII